MFKPFATSAEGDKNKKKKPSGLNNTVRGIVREKGGDKHVSVESMRDLDGES